jgi:hypothetical protein
MRNIKSEVFAIKMIVAECHTLEAVGCVLSIR